jgi:outer membrane protein assembly complex protein YaeT
MFGAKSLGRKALLCVGAAAVVVTLLLCAAHTGIARRFALGRLQVLLRQSFGVSLDAGGLDYNLLRSHFELKDVVLRGKSLSDLPAPAAARRIIVDIALWDLVRGSFDRARIQIDRLSVHFVRMANGRHNLPPLGAGGGCATPKGPSIAITNGQAIVQDEPAGLLIQLPLMNGRANSNGQGQSYGFGIEASGGRLRWRDLSLPIGQIKLKSAIAGCGFSIESLHIAAGDSVVDVAGEMKGSPASIRATARLDMDSRYAGQALALEPRPAGRLEGRLTATGPVTGFQIEADLRLRQLAIGKIVAERAALDAAFDTGTGRLRIRSLTADLFGGRLRAEGTLRTGEKHENSDLTVALAGVNPRQIGELLGAPGLPTGPAELQLNGSFAGLDWRNAKASGAIRLPSAEIAFDTALNRDRAGFLLDASMGGNARVQADLAIDLHTQSIEGALNGSVASIGQAGKQLESLLDRPPGTIAPAGADGSLRFASNLAGTLEAPSASVHLIGNRLNFDGWNGVELEAEAKYGPQQIEITRAQFSWKGQQITAGGVINGLSADSPVKLHAALTSPEMAPVLRQLGIAAPVEADLAGDIGIAGTIAHPAVEGTLRADSIAALGLQLSRATVAARWQDRRLIVSRFTAAQNHGAAPPGKVEGSGSFEPAPGRYAADVAATNFFPPKLETSSGGTTLTGAFDVTAHGEGTLADPNFQADISSAGIRVGEYDLGPVTARLEAREHRGAVRLEAPALHALATSTVAMEGAWPFEFALESDGTRLPNTAAVFDATVRGKGSLMAPAIEAAGASIRNLRVATAGPEIVGDGPMEFSYAAGRIRVDHVAIKAADSTLQLSGEIPLTDTGAPGSLAAAGAVHLDSLPQFLPPLGAARIDGLAELNARLSGSLANFQTAGTLTIRDAGYRNAALPFPIENIAAKIEIEEGLVRLRELSGSAGKGKLSGEGSVPLHLLSNFFPAPAVHSGAQAGASSVTGSVVNPGPPARFSARVEDIQLSGGETRHPSTATFSFDVTGEAPALSLSALRGAIVFDQLTIRTGDRNLRQTAPSRIELRDAVMHLEALDLKGPNGSVHGSGSLGLSGTLPLAAAIEADVDLAALSPFLKPVEASGPVQFALRANGAASDPHITGFAQLNGASLALANPLLQADDVRLRADFDGDRVKLNAFEGTLNGGPFTGGGALQLDRGGIHDVDIFLKGKDVFAEIPAGLKTSNTVDLKLESQEHGLVLRGQIEVEEGFFESPFQALSGSPTGIDTTAPLDLGSQNQTSNALALDIGIVTKRPVEMNNNLGTISGSAELRLAGDTDQVRLLGSLTLEPDGRLYFGSRMYYVERGTVQFVDAADITPELDILAYTRTEYYTIHLGLTGGLDNITSTFTSDPPLSREDTISVLLTGKTVADNRGADVRQLEAMSLASGAVNAALGSRLNRTLGVSRVSIQPGAIAAESNNPGTRVTITQDFTQTFRILYSMNLNDSNDQIWVGEYDLTRSVNTRLVKQSDNTYRGEFRHDIRFGKGTNPAAAAEKPAPKPKISAVHFTGETPFAPQALEKKFKVKPGKRYDAFKVRKAAERLDSFFVKQGYLESRVRLDRDEKATGVDLTVRIEPGPRVEMTFQGDNLSGREKSNLRKLWHAGISDAQRRMTARNAVLDDFARKGYLRANARVRVAAQQNGTPSQSRKTVQFDLTPGMRFRPVKVVTEGAAPDRAKEIRSLIDKQRLEIGSDRDPTRLVAAVTRYYQERGYLAVKVAPPVFDLDESRRTARIVAPITEGPLFHVGAINFSGNRALDGDALRAGLTVEKGQVFEPGRLEPAATAIRSKYGNLGYRAAKVEFAIERDDPHASVDVDFTIAEDKQTSIRSIRIVGNRQTSVKFAQGRLLIAEGQVANAGKIRDSMTNLSRTGAYTAANVEVKAAPEPPNPSVSEASRQEDPAASRAEPADLTVALSEPKPFRLLYGGLYDNGGGPGFIFDFQNLNRLGPGRTLGLRARYDSDDKEGRLYLTQPYWGSKQVTTTISAYFVNQVPHGQTYPTARGGIGFQQDWPSRAKLLFSYGVRAEKERAWIPVDGVLVRTPIVFAVPLTFTISREARDSFLDATRGSFMAHSFEFSLKAFGTDYPYIRYNFQYFKYFPLTTPRPVPYGETPNRSRLVFATGARIGLQEGLNPQQLVLTDRFYAGGGTTVRGFQQDSLGPKLANGEPVGGNAVVILNNELRYPLFWIFDAVSFLDVGNVFPRVSDFHFSDLRSASGFGLRIRNPFVVLRFDYGFKLDRRPGEKVGAFFFSIGQAF